ncbi:hypothetical protein QUF90_16605 [Desulfococcaceae bacterium HSG9]|nr:hypothetical protein [Desulfococcaceae bacterium HSG9]
MKSKISIILLSVFTAMLIAASSTFAFHEITVGSVAGDNGDTVVIPITVTNPGDIAAAAFTITFDSDFKFELVKIESAFFQTFTTQWARVTIDGDEKPFSGVPSVYVPTGSSDPEDEYKQPILSNLVDFKLRIAGAQVQTHDQTETADDDAITTLFKLHIKIGTDTEDNDPDVYDLIIQPTYIDNADAGYTTGEDLPYLVGSSGPTETDLTLAYPTLVVTNANDGTIEVADLDADDDGMSDPYELEHFGHITDNADENSDHDNDGYSDLIEYQKLGTQDKYGNDYHPWVPNAPEEGGYIPANDYWTRIDTVAPEQMIKYNNVLACDNGTSGVRTYDGTDWNELTHSDAGGAFLDANYLMVTDRDNDGDDDLVAGFPADPAGSVYIHKSDKLWDTIIDAANNAPDAMVPYYNSSGSILAADFGSTDGGVKSYDDDNGWTDLKDDDPILLMTVDIESNGDDDLVGSFDDGVFVHVSGTDWDKIHDDTPESMVPHGDSLVADFGSSGVQRYDAGSNTWEVLRAIDPIVLTEVDLDGDGITELVGSFSDGIFVHVSGTTWNPIGTDSAENLIPYNGGLAVDFGTEGLYTYIPNRTPEEWVRLTSMNPDEMVAVDIDYDEMDELAVYFPDEALLYIFDDTPIIRPIEVLAQDWGNYGLWTYDLDEGYIQITGSDTIEMITVDFDGDGKDELVGSFVGIGMWYYDNNVWTNFHDSAPEAMIRFGDKLAADRGTGGLYLYDPTDEWVQITGSEPIEIVTVDFDGDGEDELVGSFVGIGMWFYDNNVWTNFHDYSPKAMIRFGNKLAADWGTGGLSLYDPTNKWVPLTGSEPIEMITVDFDGDGEDELVGSFVGIGIWFYDNNVWTNFHGGSPEAMIRFGNKLAGDWGAYGLWTYDPAANWVRLTNADPIELVEVNFDGDEQAELVGSFNFIGVWFYADGWTQIHGSNPQKTITYIK